MKGRFPVTLSGPEIKRGIEILNTANRIAKVKSRVPQRVRREEAHIVRRELMHEATMTNKQRSHAERVRQENLKAARLLADARKRVAELLKGLAPKEQKTDSGIVIPSGTQIGKVLTGVAERG